MVRQQKPKWLDYGAIEKACVCGECEADSYGPPSCQYRLFLKRIVGYMQTMPIAPRMRLFGSAATGKRRPGDIDVMVDLDDPMWEGCVRSTVAFEQIPADHAKWLNQLLTMSRHAYGSIDPFFRWRGGLWVRNDQATGWTKASHARAIYKAARECGVAIVDVKTIPHLAADSE